MAVEQFSEYGSYIAFLHNVHNAIGRQEMQYSRLYKRACVLRLVRAIALNALAALQRGEKACTIAGFIIANQITRCKALNV
ncbi:hypothetical protein [Pseudomonas sp. UBA800]|uniref:hypothetical protein n=1 Tax=Pseudomonas sp. UBA800 TaxID=1947344 RepID=UPI002579EBEE|nr:hypothetical protein [Pseudomonas sp. UBA800]